MNVDEYIESKSFVKNRGRAVCNIKRLPIGIIKRLREDKLHH